MRPHGGKDLLPVFDHRQFLGIIPLHVAAARFHQWLPPGPSGIRASDCRQSAIISTFIERNVPPGLHSVKWIIGSPFA